jgi:hypothetical protein
MCYLTHDSLDTIHLTTYRLQVTFLDDFLRDLPLYTCEGIYPDASQVLAVQAEPVQPEKKIRRRKMLACTRAAGTGENGADRASELHANIAHPST